MEEQEAYLKAKKRVEAKIGFYIHLAFYVGVNILLIIINLTTYRQPDISGSSGHLLDGVSASFFMHSGSLPSLEACTLKTG